MKGVSAIIAIILILLIIVALAALAYTWFTGIFTTLTETTAGATEAATTAMGTQIRLETAKYYTTGGGGYVNTTVRNTGTSDIDTANLGAYVDGAPSTVFSAYPTGIIEPGNITTLNVTNGSTACPTGGNAIIKITTESGMSDSRSIRC